MRNAVTATVLCAGLLGARSANADEPAPESKTGAYSPYELDAIRTAEKTVGAALETSPEGKAIEAIEVVPLEVIEERDPAPRFLNQLHATSRPYVIRREVLFRVGDPYRKVIADETARNLRRLAQLSLVVVTAVKGSAPDRVRVVVVTKDVWSLRMGSNVAFTSGGLEGLLLEPTESNLAGTHNAVLGRFTYNPVALSVGAALKVPRLDGRRLTFTVDANAIVNHRTGQAEGSFGAISVARPLWSTQTEWSWLASTVWRVEVLRRFVNASLSSYDALVTPFEDRIPFEYKGRRFTQSLEVTRSFGWAKKNDFTVGAEINRREYRTFDLSRFDPAAVREFVSRNLPVGETRVGPYVEWRSYTTNFLRILDSETLALQEDYRLGHDVFLRVYPFAQAFGSSRNVVGTYAAAQYTFPLGDGYARVGVESTTEADTDAGKLSDAALGAAMRIMSPRTKIGRLVFDAAVLSRYENYLNRTTYLGGDTRLRGFPTNAYVGKDVMAYNLELRSRPIEILSCQVGGALFYDVGHAFNGFDRMRLAHGAGFGIRTLFPQVNRIVFRADLGFPLELGQTPPDFRRTGLPPLQVFVAFEQAFGVPAVGGTVATGGLAGSSGAALGQ